MEQTGTSRSCLKAIAGVGDHNSTRRLAHLERRSTVVLRQVGAARPVFIRNPHRSDDSGYVEVLAA